MEGILSELETTELFLLVTMCGFLLLCVFCFFSFRRLFLTLKDNKKIVLDLLVRISLLEAKKKLSRIRKVENRKDWCTLATENGTPILLLPNGEYLPAQTDLKINAPMDELPTATVTMFINFADTAEM